jgi:hypothetical protein
MLIYNVPNIIPANTVMNATINSSAIQLENNYGYSIQIVFTGTPTGSFKLQSSSDPVTKASLNFGANGAVTYTPTNWTDIADSTFTVTAAGNVMWNYTGLAGYNYVRVVYTDTSGGTSTAIIVSSTFNGKGA